LVDIAESVNAKCINVLLSLNSYRPKPCAYLTFKDETVKEAAMDISCAFKGVSLTWHEPNQANSLCHICGRPNCSPDTCPKSNSQRSSPTKQVKDDRLNKLHARFNRFDSQRKPASSCPTGRSQSRSRSRSQSSCTSRQNNNDNTPKFTPGPNSSSQPNRRPYGSRPWNRVASEGMHNWDDDSFGPSLNERQALQSKLGEVKILLAQISQQIQTVVSKLQYQETRLTVIEEKLDITPPDQELTPHEQSVLDNLEPMDEEINPLHLVRLPRMRISYSILMFLSLLLRPPYRINIILSLISACCHNLLLSFLLLLRILVAYTKLSLQSVLTKLILPKCLTVFHSE
jgi:hypothetical protein